AMGRNYSPTGREGRLEVIPANGGKRPDCQTTFHKWPSGCRFSRESLPCRNAEKYKIDRLHPAKEWGNGMSSVYYFQRPVSPPYTGSISINQASIDQGWEAES